MDWYLEPGSADAVRALRDEFGAYLRRHAEPGSDIEGAELVAAELVANAVRHAPGPSWVRLNWTGAQPVLEVNDLGAGFELKDEPRLPEDPLSLGGRGLYIAAHLSKELSVASKRAGGTRATAVLPVSRASERSHSPRRHRVGSLPSPEEADPDGTFSREPFLRALVVEMAKTVEESDGPDAAEAAIAQVGTDVGGRMEEEYRRAREIVGRLTPEQMGDLFVRLKAAIHGDFYVIEATEDRIVLGNRRCPFGEAVKHAPGLCRMTSSVFGGIAARNAGDAAVTLEERIAVGDPECRVTVWLTEPPEDERQVAHHYSSKAAS